MKKTISILLAVSIGFLFILSAATKVYPMELFEYQFVDIGIANWHTAPYFARAIISMEFFLGMLLFLNIALRRFTLKFAIGLLSFFCIYLSYKIITEGNAGNCGCFGESIQMSPLQGILKNIALIIACVVCYTVAEVELWSKKWKTYSIPFLLIVSCGLGFFINPINSKEALFNEPEAMNYRVPLELMYDSTQTEIPVMDLAKGKHIVAFLSLTCPHCKIAARKLAIIHKKNPDLPIYFALNGDKELVQGFLENASATTIPHNLFLGPEKWTKVAGFALPRIMYLNNSIVEKKLIGAELDEQDMEKWMHQ